MPPIALGVAANSYVGSGSITINSLVKADLVRFQAILEPVIPPPIIAFLSRKFFVSFGMKDGRNIHLALLRTRWLWVVGRITVYQFYLVYCAVLGKR